MCPCLEVWSWLLSKLTLRLRLEALPPPGCARSGATSVAVSRCLLESLEPIVDTPPCRDIILARFHWSPSTAHPPFQRGKKAAGATRRAAHCMPLRPCFRYSDANADGRLLTVHLGGHLHMRGSICAAFRMISDSEAKAWGLNGPKQATPTGCVRQGSGHRAPRGTCLVPVLCV